MVNDIDIEDMMKEVYSELGPGYSERVYHNAVEVILREKGIPYESERHILVRFRGHVVGQLRADIIINNHIILELKAIKTLTDGMELQARKYLDLTELKTAYLVNFPLHPGREVEVREIQALPLEEEPDTKLDKIFGIPHIESVDLTQMLEEDLVPYEEASELLLDSAVPLGRLD